MSLIPGLLTPLEPGVNNRQNLRVPRTREIREVENPIRIGKEEGLFTEGVLSILGPN